MNRSTSARTTWRRLALAGLLSVPLAALPLAGTATASGPPAEPGGSSASAGHGRDSAPGQEKKAESAPPTSQSSEPQQSAAGQQGGESQAPPEPASSGGGTSGTPTEPQPLSNADQNGTGANPGPAEPCSHTYCSTRDGSASENGNGGGEAGGKPCAGCVGKADNKNPPGQEQSDPRGTFPNNGYECDGNNGIGKGNPAHTGCAATPGTPGTPGNPGNPGNPGPGPGAPTVVTPSTPTAQQLPVEVLSGVLVRPTTEPLVAALSATPVSVTAGPATAASVTGVAQAPLALPFTGSAVSWMLPAALGALALGLALVGVGRSRRSA